MTTGTSSYDRDTFAAIVAGLKDIPGTLDQIHADDLGCLFGDLGELIAFGQAAMVAVTAAAEDRGVVEDAQAGTTIGWVVEQSWHSKTSIAHHIAKAAKVLQRSDLADLPASILSTDVSPNVAVTIAAEYDKLAGKLDPDTTGEVIDRMIDVGAEQGTAAVKRLRKQLLADFAPQDFQDEAVENAKAISLSAGVENAGVWDYQFTLDAEGRAVVEAAIGPGSKPRRDPDSGELDSRTVERRRGEALIDMLRRSVASSGKALANPKSVVSVTINFEDLKNQVGAGVVTGSRDHGSLIDPATIRKMACDAGIIPMILGSNGEVLDQGREERLFTTAQRKALRHRDQHCSFPGCSTPPDWCDHHHLTHWEHGGPTNLNTGALLCPRHHTIVHRDLLAGQVIAGKVVWDLTPGSYQPHQQEHAA